MFSALLLIFMVGFSLKDIFYDYMRSGYGNIADMQIKTDNLSDANMEELKDKIKSLSDDIDMLYGYEGVFNLTITDEEDSILTKDMPTLLKGLSLQNKLNVELDGKKIWLDIVNFEYDDKLRVELDLYDFKVKDKNSIKFISKGESIKPDFCTLTSIEDNKFVLESTHCKDNVDYFFQKLKDKEAKFVGIDIDNNVKNLEILELDQLYRTIVLKYDSKEKIENINIELEEISIPNTLVQSIEVYDDELIIAFKREENVELQYKRYISKVLPNYINYNRFVLNVKHYAFLDEEQSEQELYKEELVWLNELTDFLDLVTNKNGNSAIASRYLANDLNNLGVLDNFTISSKDDVEFTSDIRSTFNYNPELIYDKNILFFNKRVLKEQFNVGDGNNFIDIYLPNSFSSELSVIKDMVSLYDSDAKFIMQDEIIPSIAPKKKIFNIVVFLFSFLIFLILFIAMYVVLRQFYSNFENELALMKLFGLNQPYQTYINTISFFISSIVIYFVLCYEELQINYIIMKYFFTRYDFEMINYIISLAILFGYILIIYMLEIISIRKLNIIKGQ